MGDYTAARRMRKWYAAHRETALAKHHESYAANKAARRDSNVRWLAAHPGKANEYSATRRARRSGAGGRASAEAIASRWAMWGDRCYMCGAPATCTDHVKPVALGGTGWPANLRPACLPCNLRKGATYAGAAA
jgi:5-methylcytosine-specific restriction endonuclease McrA